MPAKLVLRGQEHDARAGMTLRHALLKLDINPETVLATRDGELITDEEIILDGDLIKLIAVISGGSVAGGDDFDPAGNGADGK